MPAKGRGIWSLVVLGIIASVAWGDTYQPAPPDPNVFGITDYDKQDDPNYVWEGRRATFDWFDTDAWYSRDYSPNDPNIGPRYTFTWSSFWNDTPNLDFGNLIMINNLDYRNDPNVHVTLTSATATCDIVASHFAIGRYWWDHWGDLRVDGVNITVAQQSGVFNFGWNAFTFAREGWGWVTLKDMTLKIDTINGGEKSVPPHQYDPCDPNNLPWDATTWTMPWPDKCTDEGIWMMMAL